MKRTPLRRTKPLRQRRREGSDIVREEKPQALLPALRPLRVGVYGGTTSGVAVVKGPPAKPGKGAPTKDEAAWMTAIVEWGCIACRAEGWGYVAPEVHHILRGGVRMGHKFTLPLCPGHHRQGGDSGGRPGLIARHPWRSRFEERYGTEWALLGTLQGVLKLQPDGSYAP